MVDSVFRGVDVPCCMSGGSCVCSKDERVLRGYMRNLADIHPMTAKQREWCLDQIDGVEGYRREDYETVSDALLANGVLDAWMDYCRDKGLL